MCRPQSNGDLQCDRISAQSFPDLIKDPLKSSALAIELIDERHPRNTILVGLSPNGFALCFHPFSRAENNHSAVENSQAPLHFRCEIDVPRSIEQIDVNVFPVKRHTGRINRDPAFLLFLVIVGRRRSTIDFSNAMLRTAKKQHPLGNRRLSGIDMSDDSDVSQIFEFASHNKSATRGVIA